MREAPPPFPVFYSVSTPQRGARLRAWLDRGGDNWCRIELPPMHPQDFDVRWEPPVYGSPVRIYLSPSTNASSAGPQPPLASTAWPQLRVGGASPDQPLFVLNAPYGNLRNQIEKGHRVGRAKSGLGSGHKVANAYFHLRAIQYPPRHTRRCQPSQREPSQRGLSPRGLADAYRCLAARCHPCLQRIGVHAAAVFEATPPTARVLGCGVGCEHRLLTGVLLFGLSRTMSSTCRAARPAMRPRCRSCSTPPPRRPAPGME